MSCKASLLFMFKNNTNLIWWTALLTIIVVSVTTRVHLIQVPNVICWDEFHFTKMSTSYVDGRFFFDIHPPLGKILLSLVGHVYNYKGMFNHKTVGEPYEADYPYVQLRLFCTLLSSFVPILCYSIVWSSTHSIRASFFSAVFLALDNSLILIGRLIILDSMLNFFMTISFFCFVKCRGCDVSSSCRMVWLMLTGLCLGLEISVKLVGIFTMSFFVCCSVYEVWGILPNRSFKMFNIAKLCGLHLLCLVFLPFVVYSGVFALHFKLLTNSGSGDYLFSPSFQSHLNGSSFSDVVLPKYVSYGGDVVLKNVGLKKYLNHPPQPDCLRMDGAVTTSSFVTEEAFWKFGSILQRESELRYVTDEDVVLMKHSMSSRLLQTHTFSSSSSSHGHLDLSCVNETDELEGSFLYKMKISFPLLSGVALLDDQSDDPKMTPKGKIILQPLKHVFHLEDINNDCFLQATDIQLSLAGHKLVTCSPIPTNENSLWYVEWITDERVDKTKVRLLPLTFWQKFVETHRIMFKVNSELEAGKSGSNSFPWQWIFNIPGQPILGPEYVIYLLGTPIVWWMSSAVLFSSVVVTSVVVAFERRSGCSLLTAELQHLLEKVLWMVFAWFVHYFPFYLMTRPLYFHHYLQAAMFKLAASGIAVHGLMRAAESHVHPLVTASASVALMAAIFNNFHTFSVLTYGVNTTHEHSERILDNLKWTRKWKF